MKARKIWIGHWVLGVAALHVAFGAVMGAGVMRGMLERGLFNSVDGNPMAMAITWFMLFGVPLALLGMTITALERAQALEAVARPMGWALLALLAVCALLMPMSGFWLFLPPAIALLRRAAPAASQRAASASASV